MVFPESLFPTRAIAYALLSQTIWLPLLAIDVHDRWQAERGRALERQAQLALSRQANGLTTAIAAAPLQPGPAAAGTAEPGQPSSGLLLGASSARIGQGAAAGLAAEEPIERSLDLPRAGRAPGQLNASSSPAPFQLRPSSDLELLRGGFRPSELLGGPLGLADLQAASMPGLAQAERARWAASGDPMAPLPGPWREAMRQAIRQLPASADSSGKPAQVSMARVVHVPSSRVRSAAEVPVALQPDGSVDILSQPGEAGVVEEIRSWSSQQQPPPQGQVSPAVVHLHPMPAAAPLSPEPAPTPAAPAPAAVSAAPVAPPVAAAEPPAAAAPVAAEPPAGAGAAAATAP
jgi:hypothetical protein